MGGYVSLKAGLNAWENRKIFCPSQESKQNTSVVQEVTRSLDYSLNYSSRQDKGVH